MPRIAHIAILAAEPAKLAEFYRTAFGFREVARSGEDGEAIYVSDGHINLALLPARNRREGIFHFGIQVEDVKGAAATALAAGGNGAGRRRQRRQGRVAQRRPLRRDLRPRPGGHPRGSFPRLESLI